MIEFNLKPSINPHLKRSAIAAHCYTYVHEQTYGMFKGPRTLQQFSQQFFPKNRCENRFPYKNCKKNICSGEKKLLCVGR